MDINLDPEFCIETYFDSPPGSPQKILQNIDLLNINGRFTPMLYGSSNRPSTRTSMVSYTPGSSPENEMYEEDKRDFILTSVGFMLKNHEHLRSERDILEKWPSTATTIAIDSAATTPEKRSCEVNRRASMMPPKSEQKSLDPDKRRHSTTPVYTYSPLPVNKNIFYEMDRNKKIKQVKVSKRFVHRMVEDG
jgi:hypothetical protein